MRTACLAASTRARRRKRERCLVMAPCLTFPPEAQVEGFSPA